MSKSQLNLVVAACNNRGIGINGQLPWRLRKDMDFFKKITTETKDDDKKNAVIMGRKTWFSIPEKFRPLAKRINIILSREMKESPKGAYLAHSLEKAIQMVSGDGDFAGQVESIYIIGGSSVYKEAIESSFPCRIYLTKVMAEFDCDAFFPELDENEFKQIENLNEVPSEVMTENEINFRFEVFEKVQSECRTRHGAREDSHRLNKYYFDIMAAMCANRGIGHRKGLPWPPLKKEYEYYNKMTETPYTEGKKCVCIQGRSTWEATSEKQMRRENVLNIVMTRNQSSVENMLYVHHVASTFEDALDFCFKSSHAAEIDRVWVLGGQAIYQTAVEHDLCRRIYLTYIEGEFPADKFFPAFEHNFREILDCSEVVGLVPSGENGINYEIKVYEKKLTADRIRKD